MKINPADHLRLVHKIANRYHVSSGEPFDDLYNQGYLGLDKAANRFNPELGYKFSCFAYTHISGAITHYLRDKSNLIRNPKNTNKIYCLSLDTKIYRNDERTTLLDTIPSLEKVDEDYSDLYAAIDTLPARQRSCLAMKYVENCTRKTIAQKLNISTQSVTTNINKAEVKLRQLLSVA